MNKYMEKRNEKGFTLIELLIAIVVVGILAAVAIVGIGGLTKTGGTSACKATADAAKTSSAAYYAANNNTWPTSFTQMTGGTPPVFDKGNLAISTTNTTDDTIGSGSAWKLVGVFPGTGTSPTFDPTAAGNC